MKKKNLSEMIVKITPVFLLPLAVLYFGYLINSAQESLTGVQIGIGVLGIVGIVLMVTFSLYMLIQPILNRMVEDAAVDIATRAIESYESKRLKSETISSTLLTLRQLQDIETTRMYNGNKLVSVTIISSDFSYDIDGKHDVDQKFKNVVVKNARDGIKYVYYITDNYENKKYVERIIEQSGSNVEMKLLGEDFFFIAKFVDFVVYHTENEDGLSISFGFMPLSDIIHTENEADIIYHTPLSKELTGKIMSNISKY